AAFGKSFPFSPIDLVSISNNSAQGDWVGPFKRQHGKAGAHESLNGVFVPNAAAQKASRAILHNDERVRSSCIRRREIIAEQFIPSGAAPFKLSRRREGGLWQSRIGIDKRTHCAAGVIDGYDPSRARRALVKTNRIRAPRRARANDVIGHNERTDGVRVDIPKIEAMAAEPPTFAPNKDDTRLV